MNKIKRLTTVSQKDKRHVIGLMTGMSRDGIDLAHVTISGRYPDCDFQLCGTLAAAFSETTRQLLEQGDRLSTYDMTLLDRLLAEDLAASVNTYLSCQELAVDDIDLIGCHGQTIVHIATTAEQKGASLQVGSGSMIAELTHIPTVTNFRSRDIICGGQGAPLIPIVDYLLYRKVLLNDGIDVVALNNLGSISNVTVVTPRLSDCLAFDTGPANMPIDYFARLIKDNKQGIDHDGSISSQGKINETLLQALLALPYFDQAPPKSAGYHEFGPEVLASIASKMQVTPFDSVRTAVEFSAATIAQAYENFIVPRYPNLQKIILTGGGVYNNTLVNSIKIKLPQYQIESLATTDKPLNDAKEALGFAILADLTLQGETGNVISATGAERPVILGEIAP